MSKSARTKSRVRTHRTNIPPIPRVAPSEIDGIDYAPAAEAVIQLAEWAFDLATRGVEGYREDERRVGRARRYVVGLIRGKHRGGTPYEDVLFTASLLARIFESDLGLDAGEMIEVLDLLSLPTEVVPRVIKPQPTRAKVRPPVIPLRARSPRSAGESLAPDCHYCGLFRNAA